MFKKLKSLLGFGPAPDFATLVKDGAVIIDVRSQNEFNQGHIHGSVNIPVNELRTHLPQFKEKNKTFITCCASGVRSAAARNILKANGYSMVLNGGNWQKLNQKIK